MKSDIEKLKRDISIYETHIQKTDLWCDNLGKWKTKVVSLRQSPGTGSSVGGSHLAVPAAISLASMNSASSAPVSSASETAPLFEIHVELRDDETSADTEAENNRPTGANGKMPRFREGWVIYRSYRQFEMLNESLIELISPEIRVKFKRIPSSGLKRASSSSKSLVDEQKSRNIVSLVDDYLRMICTDESLSQSEALYSFLCPSPEYFKRSNSQQLPTYNTTATSDEKFSIGSIFKM